MKQKAEFLLFNKDVIAAWKPLANNYSIKVRDLSMCSISTNTLEPVRNRLNGVIWAYHISTGQHTITQRHEQYSGCFQALKAKVRPAAVAEIERITDTFELADSASQAGNIATPWLFPLECSVLDEHGEQLELQSGGDLFDLNEPGDEPSGMDGQQVLYQSYLPLNLQKVVYRDQGTRSPDVAATPSKRCQRTPVQPAHSATLRHRCPFSSLQRLQHFQTPHPLLSAARSYAEFSTGWTSPGPDGNPLALLVPQELPKPPKKK